MLLLPLLLPILIILVIKQIGPPLLDRPTLLITCMITDRRGLHSVLLPLQTLVPTRMAVSLYLNVFRLSFRLFSRYCFLEEYEFASKISGPDS